MFLSKILQRRFKIYKMKKYIIGLFFLLAAGAVLDAQSGLCDTAYWNHTYSNYRLKIYDSCLTITGVVKVEIPPSLTADGDYHIYVQPDSQYQWMQYFRDSNYIKLCEGDDSSEYELVCASCLNVEEVCKGAVVDVGASGDTEKAACANFSDTVYLPNTGERVEVTGPYVYDIIHCWNELHPVSKMVVGYITNIPEPEGSTFLDGMKLFPQPARNEVEFDFAHPPHSLTFVKLYNAAGQLLFIYGMAETSYLHLDISTWPTGEYPYAIVSQEQARVLKSGVISVVK